MWTSGLKIFNIKEALSSLQKGLGTVPPSEIYKSKLALTAKDDLHIVQLRVTLFAWLVVKNSKRLPDKAKLQ